MQPNMEHVQHFHLFKVSKLFKHMQLSNEYALSDQNIRILRQNVNLGKSSEVPTDS